MTFYIQPERKLTDEEKLLSAVIGVDHRIPVGFQLGMPMHLDSAIVAVEALFAEHKLPMREELVAELTLWRSHTEDGLKFAQRCDSLMREVIRVVDAAAMSSQRRRSG